jgi:hypothetical protein
MDRQAHRRRRGLPALRARGAPRRHGTDDGAQARGDNGLWSQLRVEGPLVVVGIATWSPGTKADSRGSPAVAWPWPLRAGSKVGWTYTKGRASKAQVERCREWALAALDAKTGTSTTWDDRRVCGAAPDPVERAAVWFDRADGPVSSFMFDQGIEPPAGEVMRDRGAGYYDVRAYGSDGRQALTDRFPLPRALAPLCASILAGPARPPGSLFA